MANSGLYGPHKLDPDSVKENVIGVDPGCYVLGGINGQNGDFIVDYVGRSDDDLGNRLNQWCQEMTNYTHFKYAFYKSAEGAFKKECYIFHDFGGPEGKLDNKVHPAATGNWACPVCEELNE